MISSPWLECRFPVGSSARINFGLAMIARATPTSCCWPPESWRGYKSFFADDLKTIERVRYSRRALVLADLSIRERDLEIFVNGQIVEQMILLKNEADLFVAQRGPLFGFQMMNGCLVQKIFATPAVIVHAENVEQRRFAGAGRAHDRNEFAFGDFDVDVAQDVEKFSVSERITAFEIFKSNHGGYSVRNAWIGLT